MVVILWCKLSGEFKRIDYYRLIDDVVVLIIVCYFIAFIATFNKSVAIVTNWSNFTFFNKQTSFKQTNFLSFSDFGLPLKEKSYREGNGARKCRVLTAILRWG